MSQRISLDSPEFGSLFAQITRRWFRLETLQSYDVSGEREQFDAFQAGESLVPHDPADGQWAEMIRSHVAAGRSLQRVHIASVPLSDYLKYEIVWGYQPALEAGEDIRVIPVDAEQWPANLPREHDYWFLDEQLWTMTYDAEGRPLYAEQITDSEIVAQHEKWRKDALELSRPASAFIAESSELSDRFASSRRL